MATNSHSKPRRISPILSYLFRTQPRVPPKSALRSRPISSWFVELDSSPNIVVPNNLETEATNQTSPDNAFIPDQSPFSRSNKLWHPERVTGLRASLPAFLRRRNKSSRVPVRLGTDVQISAQNEMHIENSIKNLEELLHTTEYQVNLLRQRWSTLNRHNFYAQLAHCRNVLERALDTQQSFVAEVRNLQMRNPREWGRLEQAWHQYNQWILTELHTQVAVLDKDPVNPSCLNRGRHHAQLLEEKCRIHFSTQETVCIGTSPADHSHLASELTTELPGFHSPKCHMENEDMDSTTHLNSIDLISAQQQQTTPMRMIPHESLSEHNSHNCMESTESTAPQMMDSCSSEEQSNVPLRPKANASGVSGHLLKAFSQRHSQPGLTKGLYKASLQAAMDNQGQTAPADNVDSQLNAFFDDESIQQELAAALSAPPDAAFDDVEANPQELPQEKELTDESSPPESQRDPSTSDTVVVTKAGNLSRKSFHTTEVDTDSEDGEEIIELNGKLYRHRYTRHVKVTRHHIRQIIEAPAGVQLELRLEASQQKDNDDSRGSEHGGMTGLATVDATVVAATETQPPNNSVHKKEMDLDNDLVVVEEPQHAFSFPLDAKQANSPQPLSASEVNQQLTTVSQHVSTQLLNLFRHQWHKTEHMFSPNDRSKTISCIRRYTQQGPSGQMLHRTMCVQQTRSLRTRLKGEHSKATKSTNSNVLQDGVSFGVNTHSEDEISHNQQQQNDGHNDIQQSVAAEMRWPNESKKGECGPCDRGSGATTFLPASFLHSLEAEAETYSSSEDSVLNEIRLHSPNPSRQLLLRELCYVQSRGIWSHVLEQLDASRYIFFCKDETTSTACPSPTAYRPMNANGETPRTLSIKAAPLDALLVYATTIGKLPNDFYLFYEAFMTTFKMFASVEDVVDKLIGRYAYFRLGGSEEELTITRSKEKNPSISLNVEERDKLCTAILSVLLTVVSHIRRDLTPQVEARLAQFQYCLYVSAEHRQISEMLQQTVQRQVEERERYQRHLQELEVTAKLKKLKTTHSARSLHPLGDPTGPRSASNSVSSTASVDCLPLTHQAVTVKRKSLLDFSPRAIAEELTLIGEEIFDWIDMEDLFESRMSASVRPLCDHHNTLVAWTKTQLYAIDREPCERHKYFVHLVEVARELRSLHNFNGYIAVVLGLDHAPDCVKPKRLKQKVRTQAAELLPVNVRVPIYAEQMSASPPAILYMGLVYNLLTYLEINPAFEQPHPNCPELGKTISIWRYWRHFVIINFFYRKRMDLKRSHYMFAGNPEVRAFLNNFEDVLDEEALTGLRGQLVSSSKHNS